MYPHHKNTYLPILPVLELLSYKLGGECTSRYETVWLCVELQEAFVSHPQHKEQMWSRGSEKRRRAEDGTSKGRQCWDPPLLRAAGTPKYERLWGQPSSARQRVSLPCLGFLLHLLPAMSSFLSFALTWQVSESLNWVMNLGKKACFFALFCCTGEFESDDCLTSSAQLSARATWSAATRENGLGQEGRRKMVEEGWDLLP